MGKADTPLKDRNAAALWAFLGLNIAVFLAVMLHKHVAFSSVEDLWRKVTDTRGMAALGIPVLVVVLNGLLPARWKERMVFLRWRNPLPGSRVFTTGRQRDTRVDWAGLDKAHGPFPEAPARQNALWYKLYRKHRDIPAILNAHRVYLLTRDLTAFAALLLVACSLAGIVFLSMGTAFAYTACLFMQWFVVRITAGNYGMRFALDVLAEESHAG